MDMNPVHESDIPTTQSFNNVPPARNYIPVSQANSRLNIDENQRAEEDYSWSDEVDQLVSKLLNYKEIPQLQKERFSGHTPWYPRLVLSVIGDSRSFVPKPWVTQVLKLGLLETAKGAKDCLVLYNGSKEKVSSLVQKAVQDFRVMNNHKDGDETFIKLVGLEEIDSDREKIIYEKNHAELLAKMTKKYIPLVELKDDLSLKMKVPVLVIVAEGDMSTLDTVFEVVQKKIPVLILQGSGKAADLIAECIEDNNSVRTKAPLLFGIYFNESTLSELTKRMENIVQYKQFVNIFNIKEQNETDFPDAVVNSIIRAWAHGDKGNGDNYRPVKSAMRNHKILYEESVVNTPPAVEPVNGELQFKPIMSNGSVMNGGITSSKYRRRKSVEPLEFNTGTTVTFQNVNIKGIATMGHYLESLQPASLRLYFYIAYQFIQEMSPKDTNDRTKNFQILLQQAIIANRVDYVSVLLHEEGVEFDKEHFTKIYEVIMCNCKDESDCQHILSILKGISSSAFDGITNVEKGEKEKDKRNKKINEKIIMAGRQLCQKLLHYPQHSYGGFKYKKKEIFHDLLLWAIFANRHDLAALFWTKCENQLLTAILGCCVLKNMADKARSGKDQSLYDDLRTHSRIFEKRAIDLQTELYNADSETAMELMLTEDKIWDIKVSPLECAFDNARLDFIAHSCAQRRLNKIWYKKIGVNLMDFWKNGLFCGCKMKIENAAAEEKKRLRLARFFYAPLTRFLVHYIIFLAAMVSYSGFLLVELSEYKGLQSIKYYEWALYVWLLGDMMEEYRGILPWNNNIIRSRFKKKKLQENTFSQSTFYRFKRYIYDFWNALDMISYIICISAICVRFFDDEVYARRLHSLGLFTIYMRFLHAILMSRKMGPKIIMIKEMLKDLFRFIGILFIFMIGVGILYHANMYPAHIDMWNPKGWTYWRMWKIMYIPYWQIYGELFLDKFEANSTTPCTTIESEWESNPDIERCNQHDWVLIVIAALYMLLSNLLLVNLVIAVFSYRFEIVQGNSERLWRYWRYAVIMDYRTRVPAPLNLVLRPFMFIYNSTKRCKRCRKGDKQDDKEIERMEILQTISADKCIRAEKMQKDSAN